ncbi:phosphatidylinositol-specific phospholipase C1-like protein [Pedobacter sp. NJ-S-72]
MTKTLSTALLLFVFPLLMPKDGDDLPINKIQVIGSHNSYKKAIDSHLFERFKLNDSVSSSKIDYEHIGVTSQLDMGLRNLEIDVYADSKGGKYAHPRGLDWVKDQAPYDVNKEMDAPGFKVFHIQDLDFRSDFLTLKGGLEKLKKWSDAHPDHTPVFVTLEAKDNKMKGEGYSDPEKFAGKTFDQLDRALIDGLGKDKIIMPDEVRGEYRTLEAAVLKDNWPALKKARGKFLFILDQKEEKMELYIKGHPSLKGRVLFVNAEAGRPEAGMMIINDAKDPAIPQLIKKGYIIRTRADSDTREARINDRSNFDAACASGAQIITTDYYLKSTHFKSDYVISFEGGKYFRLNPFFK